MKNDGVLPRSVGDGAVGGDKPCPPHGPVYIRAVRAQTYAAQCLTCGLTGPEREGSWTAKLAFDKAFQPAG